MNDDRHLAAGRIGITLLIAGLLGISSPTLWAQSAETPPAATAPAQTDVAPGDNPPATGKETSTQDRQRAYRRQKEELKAFTPSEEIRVDKAVDFPVDI